VKNLLLLLILLNLVGCGSTQVLKDDVIYEHTLRMTVNKRTFVGLGVVEIADKYDIKIENPKRGDLDYLILKSEHRFKVFEDEGGTWKGTYRMDPDMEDGMLHVQAYDEKGQHSFGALILKGDEKLNMLAKCNGEIDADTVIGCQSMQGLIQSISFSENVVGSGIDNPPHCDIKFPKTFKKLKYYIRKDFCNYRFKGESGREARLVTHGFESPLIPSGK
jgi:hypothetical protein